MASALTKAFFSGDKPKVPQYETIDFDAEQQAATYGNRLALPGLMSLGRKIDAYNLEQLLNNMEKVLPGYAALRDKGTELLQSQLSGEIPDDVAREVQRHSAEASRSGGYGGSEMARNLTSRDLGLTSLDITNKALDSASRWMSLARSTAPTFDVTSMFISPSERIRVKMVENQQKFQRDWMKSQIDALPEPWEAAVGEIFNSIEEVGQSIVASYAGMATGGAGGMGGMGGGGAGAATGAKAAGNYLGTSTYLGTPTQ